MTGCEPQDDGPSISFDLTTRVVVQNRLAIVLHLFREGICIVTRTIDTVDQRDAAYVIATCRDSLERRGFSRFEDEEPAFGVGRRRVAGAR